MQVCVFCVFEGATKERKTRKKERSIKHCEGKTRFCPRGRASFHGLFCSHVPDGKTTLYILRPIGFCLSPESGKILFSIRLLLEQALDQYFLLCQGRNGTGIEPSLV